MNIYIFPIIEIECIIIDYLDILSIVNLMYTNKYYVSQIKYNKLYVCFKSFYDNVSSTRPNNNKQYKFIMACKYNYLNVAKYFINTYPDHINIHKYNKYAFQLSCEKGNLKIAQWLLEWC